MGYGVAMPTRYYRHMSAEERETLSLGLARGHSLRTMAWVLGRAPSTVSREHTRNAMSGPYRACTAHAWRRLGPVSRGGRAKFWIPGCGSTSGHT